jgi:hypothetical protein
MRVWRTHRRASLARVRAEWGKARHRSRRMAAIAAYHWSRVAAAGPETSLDARTWDDLELDAVFAIIDRAESTLGQQALYHRLRTAPEAANLEAFEALTSRMSGDVPSREGAQLALARLQDPHGYDLCWLARPDAVETQWWHVAFPILTSTVLLLTILSAISPVALPAVIAALLVNVIVRFATDRRIGAVTGAFRQLAPLIATAQSLEFLRGRELDEIVGPLRAEVPRLGRLKTIARWVSGDPFMLPLESSWLAIGVTDVANVVYEYLNLLLLLDANALYFGARELRACGPSLLGVITAVGDIDAALSVASFRAGVSGWTRPRFLPPGGPIVLTDVRHPLLADAVPNSIELGPPHGVLITGSNMSGKSTFLRTVGVSAVLAQTIHTCLATSYQAPILSVRSCIGRRDDLLAGKSYYIVEVEALLELVRASAHTGQHLFLFDELFRGTNAIERIAAAEAVLRELIVDGTRFKRHIVLAATHDGELVELLHDAYAAVHFSDALGADGLVFEYRLRQGPTTTRNAIALLGMRGAPATLMARALATAAALQRRKEYSLTREAR